MKFHRRDGRMSQHCDICYEDAFFQGSPGFYTQRVDDALAEIERLPGRPARSPRRCTTMGASAGCSR
jgi:hypothetical protein